MCVCVCVCVRVCERERGSYYLCMLSIVLIDFRYTKHTSYKSLNCLFIDEGVIQL